MTLSFRALNAIMHNQRYLLLSSQRKICFSKTTSTIDLCTTLDTSVQHALKKHMSRSQNTKADALAALATTLALPVDTEYHLTVTTRHLVCSKHMLRTREVYNVSTDLEPKDWRFPLINYVLHGLLPDDPKEATSIRRRSLRFYYDPTLKTLYCRSYDGILLRCLS